MDIKTKNKLINIIEDIEDIETESSLEREDKKEFKIIINVNEICNLKCKYCYEKKKNGKIFNVENTIEYLKDFNYEEYDYVTIEFRGGEPLLCFAKIKEVIDYIENQEYSSKIFYYIITNGTLITDEISDYFYTIRKKTKFIVSLDGPKNITDKNRDESYDDIKFDLIRKICNPINVSMTLVPEDTKYLYETLSFFLKGGFKVRTNLELNANWTKNTIDEYYQSCIRFIDDYSEFSLGKIFTIFSYGQFLKYDGLVTPTTKHCSFGESRLLLDFDGTIKMCQMFSESVNPKVENLPLIINPNKCVNCKVFYGCQFCYGSALKNGNDFSFREESLCEINIARMLCACYYNILRIKLKKQKNIEDLKRLSKLKEIVQYLLSRECNDVLA